MMTVAYGSKSLEEISEHTIKMSNLQLALLTMNINLTPQAHGNRELRHTIFLMCCFPVIALSM